MAKTILQDLLTENIESLSGPDLLLYNLAYQIDVHSGVDYGNLQTISEIVDDFESMLDDVDL
jgi:hypothetical protein